MPYVIFSGYLAHVSAAAGPARAVACLLWENNNYYSSQDFVAG